MIELEKGMLVRHASLGLGKVVALEPRAVHVFFVGRDSRFAAKLRLPDAATLLHPAGPEERVWLGGVSAFALDAETGRYGYAETWIPHDEAVARFLKSYPKGFADPLYTGNGKARPGRASRIRSAHEAWSAALGQGRGEQLLAAGDVATLVSTALAVEKTAGANTSGADKASLAGVVRDPAAAARFFGALFDLLATSAPEEARFDALAGAVTALPRDAGGPAWPLATLLPFLAQPDRHILLRPKLISQAAHRLGLELRFAAEPNWTTYSTLLRSAEQLLEKLRGHGARDLVDVEAFLANVTARPAAARDAGAAQS